MSNFKPGDLLRWSPNQGDLAGKLLTFIEYKDLGVFGRLAVVRTEDGEVQDLTPTMLREVCQDCGGTGGNKIAPKEFCVCDMDPAGGHGLESHK